jgi:hypothetical protein
MAASRSTHLTKVEKEHVVQKHRQRMPRSTAAFTGRVLLVLLLVGCGRKQLELAPLSGVVTVQGKPLANVSVVFQPVAKPGRSGEAGFGSSAITDSNGRFQLRTLDNRSGAVVGRHVVRLALQNPQTLDSDEWGAARIPSPLPPRAADGSLTFEVPAGGSDKAKFDF